MYVYLPRSCGRNYESSLQLHSFSLTFPKHINLKVNFVNIETIQIIKIESGYVNCSFLFSVLKYYWNNVNLYFKC